MHVAASARTLLFLAIASGLASCYKGTSTGPQQGDDNTLAPLFMAHREAAVQHFQVDAVAGGTITGAGNVQVSFGPDAFRKPNGAAVTGQVEVSLLEVLDVHDMIWYNAQTVGNDNGTVRILKSGGAVRVTARQGAQELVLGPGGMSVVVPTTDYDPNMQLFTEDRNAEDLIWSLSDTTTIDTAMIETPNGWLVGYQLQVDSLQWINCDYFSGTDQVFIGAVTPNDVPNDSTLVWLVLPDLNAVAQVYPVAPHTYSFGEVPPGLSGVMVGLTRNGNEYRSAFTALTTASGLSVGLSFQYTTLSDFELAVDGL